MKERPDKATVQRILATEGNAIEIRNTRLIEDAEGVPWGTHTTTETGFLAASPETLGWTEDELANPNITE